MISWHQYSMKTKHYHSSGFLEPTSCCPFHHCAPFFFFIIIELVKIIISLTPLSWVGQSLETITLDPVKATPDLSVPLRMISVVWSKWQYILYNVGDIDGPCHVNREILKGLCCWHKLSCRPLERRLIRCFCAKLQTRVFALQGDLYAKAPVISF